MTCYRQEGHDGPHEDATWKPCRVCGGLDEHVRRCEATEETDVGPGDGIVVQWEAS